MHFETSSLHLHLKRKSSYSGALQTKSGFKAAHRRHILHHAIHTSADLTACAHPTNTSPRPAIRRLRTLLSAQIDSGHATKESLQHSSTASDYTTTYYDEEGEICEDAHPTLVTSKFTIVARFTSEAE